MNWGSSVALAAKGPFDSSQNPNVFKKSEGPAYPDVFEASHYDPKRPNAQFIDHLHVPKQNLIYDVKLRGLVSDSLDRTAAERQYVVYQSAPTMPTQTFTFVPDERGNYQLTSGRGKLYH